MTFYHKCDKCGNVINLSNRVNADLPELIKARVRFNRGGLEAIEKEYLGRIKSASQIMNRPNRKNWGWPNIYSGKLVPCFITEKVWEFDQVDGEYEAHDSFWSMEDVIVTCPNCGWLEGWAAYETPADRDAHYTALCSTRNEDE